MRSGQAHSVLVIFDAGLPDGDVSYQITGGASGTVTPALGAVSTLIQISGAQNQLDVGETFGFRDLEWSYTSAAQVVNGNTRWTLEASIPFPATSDGSRAKLGIEDLPDDLLQLAKAYVKFANKVGETALAAFETGSTYAKILIADAIEAQAALDIIPTLQVRVAKTESSGTNNYTRQDVDWALLAETLRAYVDGGVEVVTPASVIVSGGGFSVTTPADILFPDG